MPVTSHRVLPPSEATAQVHLATGPNIDVWRSVPGARQIAYADIRTPAEREEYAALRAAVVRELRATGRDDLVDVVDGNLFGASLDERIGRGVRQRMERMLEIGLPAAVFVAPPDARP